MPKFASHILFAEAAYASRPQVFPGLDINAYRFGSVGPDVTVLMFDPFTNQPAIREAFNAVLEIFEKIHEVKKVAEKITDLLGKPASDVQDWLTGGLSTDLKYTFNASTDLLINTAKLGVAFGTQAIDIKNPLGGLLNDPKFDSSWITNPDFKRPVIQVWKKDSYGFPFRMFGHPYTDDPGWTTPKAPGDYSEWWWMDMLHYRSTGDFAEELLRGAAKNGNRVQRSYAQGYMTHVAGDISGHPFINSLVQGPFRNHAYRHMVLESLADTWLWANKGRGDILSSRLDELVDVNESELDQIAELFVSSLKNVYLPPYVPKLLANRYPTKGEYKLAYSLLRKYLRLATNGTISRPSPPATMPAEIIKELQDLLSANNPGPPPPWDPYDVWSYLSALFGWFAKGAALIVMISTVGHAAFMRILTVSPRWAIYLINLGIFYMISAVRTLLALVGWGYAGKDDFDTFRFLRQMVTSVPSEGMTYPQRGLQGPRDPFYWLIPPSRYNLGVEQPSVYSFPSAQPRMPSWMMDPANKIDSSHPDLINNLLNAIDPASAKLAEEALMAVNSNGLGNAVDLALMFLTKELPTPNLDLDGDRGFGWKCWEALPPNDKFI